MERFWVRYLKHSASTLSMASRSSERKKQIKKKDIYDQRHTETGDPARLPAQVAGQYFVLSSQGRTKIYCTGTTSPKKQPRKDPFHMYSKSPHLPQFQQSASATRLSSLSDKDTLPSYGHSQCTLYNKHL
jgi:hypothetical protein